MSYGSYGPRCLFSIHAMALRIGCFTYAQPSALWQRAMCTVGEHPLGFILAPTVATHDENGVKYPLGSGNSQSQTLVLAIDPTKKIDLECGIESDKIYVKSRTST